jgi:hypothetical protein
MKAGFLPSHEIIKSIAANRSNRILFSQGKGKLFYGSKKRCIPDEKNRS